MDNKSFNEYFQPIKLVYEHDNDVHMNVTSSNNFLYNDILDNCKDVKINNYSCMFVTEEQPLSSNINIEASNNKNINITNGTTIYENVSGGVAYTNNTFKNNILVNVQYTTISGDDVFPCNILPLKNQKTYTNRDTFSNYWKSDVINSIETIQTGTWQEHGNNNIYTINEFYMQDIEILPGDNYITTPDSLFPFETLDINDTTFIKTGAFGASSPIISDRIYSNRYSTFNNAILLCTWLSSNTDGEGIWLDRYYNPSVYQYNSSQILNADAVIAEAFNEDSTLRLYGYFDKQSNLRITPNMNLIYHHITQDDVNSYNNALNVTYISAIEIKNSSDYTICTTNSINLSGDIYGYASLNNLIHNIFSISFDVDIYNWNESVMYELFSCQSNNCGIRIYKKNPLTPILFAWKNINEYQTSVYLYNTNFEKIDEILLNVNALDIKRDENLQHLIVRCSDAVYIFTLFGALLYQFSVDNCISIDCNETTVYIADDYSVSAFDIYSFASKPVIDQEINFTTVPNTVVYGDNSIIYGTQIYKVYTYVNDIGLLYLDNTGIIRLRYNNDTICEINENTDSEYLRIHAPTYIDKETGKTEYENGKSIYPILDFTINNNKLYAVTESKLFISNVDRSDLHYYNLPILSTGETVKNVYVTVTSEIKNHHFINNVYILLSDERQDIVDLYLFNDDNFSFIKTFTDLQDLNLYNLTGSKNISPCTLDTYFEISFKTDHNKVIKHAKKIDPISSGKHTLLITIDTQHNNYCLYVDAKQVCKLDIPGDNYMLSYDLLQNHIVIGNTLLYNGGNLASYTQNNQLLLNNITIGDVYLYNKILTNENMYINALKSKNIPSITLNLPCGQRCAVNQIQSFYTQTVPGFKSSHFDIIIKNLQLSETNQTILTNAIKQYIEKYIPATTKLENILYNNY